MRGLRGGLCAASVFNVAECIIFVFVRNVLVWISRTVIGICQKYLHVRTYYTILHWPARPSLTNVLIIVFSCIQFVSVFSY